jgi:hypothetical protein
MNLALLLETFMHGTLEEYEEAERLLGELDGND